MKILVTGGTGFIGSHLAKELMENQIEVILLDLQPDYSLLSGLGQGIEVIEGDLLDLPRLSGILEHYRPQVVVHLAAFRNTESQEKPLGAFRLNCQGTMHVLEAARKAGVQRMVYASSVAVYGSPSYYRQLGFNPYRLAEEAPPNPYNVYGVTKLCNEGMAQQYSLIYGLQTIGLRLPIILGPGKKAGSKTSLFNDLIELPLKGKPAQIDSYANQVINFMYVKDTAHALAASEWTASAGPRFMVRTDSFNFFVHAMPGFNRVSYDAGVVTHNGIGAILGGGMDIPISKMFSWRLFEADYVWARHNFSNLAGPESPSLRRPISKARDYAQVSCSILLAQRQ